MNEGFQIRDFQTSQGGFPIIDPEVLGRLRQEASAMRNKTVLNYLRVMIVLLFILVVPVILIGVRVRADKLLFAFVAALCCWVIVSFCAIAQLRRNSDGQLTSLVESYQSVFLKEYGVELGFGKFSLLPQGGGCVMLPGIYLRSPRRSSDNDAPIGEGCNHVDGCFPPVYLVPLIPGEIHIDEGAYDAASMKVDAETWALLQTTHQKMIQVYRGVRVYEEVTKVVNETLQKDENTVHLSVEFHDSECPGREGNFALRYQFVQRALAHTTKHPV